MFGFRKSPSPANKAPKPNSVNPPSSSSSTPFDSDTESDKKQTTRPARRTSSEPVLITPKKSNYFDDDSDDDDWGRRPSSSLRTKNAQKNKSSANQRDFDSMSTQELESYAVDRSEDTTKSVNNCVKIAEDIRQDATRTLDTLHQQGEQINRTHNMCVDMDKDLSKGEKLLNNLGGMFSKPWKPKKTREIKGPVMSKDDNTRKLSNAQQREELGLSAPKGRVTSRTPPPEPTNAMQKIEMEKAKQDDGLSDLSDILGDLKGMASEMGTELDRQNKALDHLSDDVDELNSRVKGANQRARKLVAK